MRKEIQEVNWQRKETQQIAGKKLSELENRFGACFRKNLRYLFSWASLVAKNYDIEEALLKLENEAKLMQSGRHVKKQFGF